MGAPYFQVRQRLAAINGVALSSNYVLYADMSRRAMRLIRDQIPDQEVYSIDECFVDLSGFPADRALVQAFNIRQRLLQCLSLPVSIGIGSTKTQAKLASEMVKQQKYALGVCDLSGTLSAERQSDMARQPVSRVWGVGHRTAQTLESAGVHTVGDLLAMPETWIRRRFSINLLRTVSELKGRDEFAFQDAPEPRKQIIASRSFGQPVYARADLVEAVSTFVARAAERLREDRSLTSMIQVYYRAQDLSNDSAPCTDGVTLPLFTATDDTRQLTRQGLKALDLIYRPGLKYKKAGVVLTGISSANQEQKQPDLLEPYPTTREPNQTMQLMDRVNRRYGRDTLRIASMGFNDDAPWHMSCSRRSRRYTTALEELPVFSASGMS
jgi:DNA polymerase V